MDRFKRYADLAARWSALIMVAMFGVGIAAAQAGDCAPVRASADSELARLQRQIAANRALQVKYSCNAVSTFACREIAGRIAGVSTRLAGLSAAPRQSCGKPAADRRSVLRRQAASAPRTTAALPQVSARIETRCVRLSDGYSFPTPNSGYNSVRDVEEIAAQCRFICDDPAMNVYRMTGTDRSTDEMISVTTGMRYAELPRAGAYRKAAALKTCDMNRFYKTVLSRTPSADITASTAVVSSYQAVQPKETVDATVALLSDVGLRGTAGFLPPPARKVRMVGAAFLPVN